MNTESHAHRIGALIGEALAILAAGALLGTLGAWVAIRIVGALLVLA